MLIMIKLFMRLILLIIVITEWKRDVAGENEVGGRLHQFNNLCYIFLSIKIIRCKYQIITIIV